MRACRLTVFAVNGKKVGDAPLSLPTMPLPIQLDSLYRNHLAGTACRYAVVREGNNVRALFLARDLLPARASKLGRTARIPGRWATSSLDFGTGIDAIVGPGLFFRLADLRPDERWIEPVLRRFATDIQTLPRHLGEASVREWRSYEQLWLIAEHRGKPTLFGAGNTPPDRLEAVLAEAQPADVAGYLWAIGAVSMD